MKKYTLLASAGIAVGLLAAPAFAQQDNCRGNPDLTKFKSYEQGAHVFTARNSDRGRGNGGESILIDFDVQLNRAYYIEACVKTADEDTGAPGGVSLFLTDGTPVGFVDTPEQDPGKGNQ